jgi:hypothetical protein
LMGEASQAFAQQHFLRSYAIYRVLLEREPADIKVHTVILINRSAFISMN